MNGKSKNIFVVHTPFQLFISELIADNLFSDETNVLISEFEVGETKVNWDTISKINTSGEKRFGHENWKTYRKYLVSLNSMIEGTKYVNFFVSDIAWPLNNVIFGLFKGRSSISIFQDGIGAYSNPQN